MYECCVGKYNSGVIPADSRYATTAVFKQRAEKLSTPGGQATLNKVKALTEIAEKEFGVTTAQLALAWVAKNPNVRAPSPALFLKVAQLILSMQVSSLIIGASKPEQVVENLKALEILPKLTDEIYAKINAIFGSMQTDRKPRL
jgi:aryl-alcohol dehydrogenase-like predicted oxidoreductase